MEQSVEWKYRCAFRADRPKHGAYDEFSLRHPRMPLGRRAKIFSPFSALRGFDEAIGEKLATYVERRELTEEEQQRLESSLAALYEKTKNRRAAKASRVRATVSYFVPCRDENHEAYGRRGSYAAVSGVVWRVDPILRRSLRIGEVEIEFADIAEIRIEASADEEE